MHDTPLPPDRPRRRDYASILEMLEKRWKRHPLDRTRIMQEIVEALWNSFGERGLSWVGFYLPTHNGRELILGPHCDKPAVSPVGGEGLCGRAVSTRATQFIENRSEIAVPVAEDDGAVFAVLHAGFKTGKPFEDEDRRWLERLVKGLANSEPKN